MAHGSARQGGRCAPTASDLALAPLVAGAPFYVYAAVTHVTGTGQPVGLG